MLVMLVVVGGIVSAIAARDVYKQRRAAVNTLAIEAALRAYSQALKPGMTRGQVQDYLHSRGVNFFERCCFEPRGAFSVLVKVGQEDAPWYCSEWPDYVAFEFNATESSNSLAKPARSDVLKVVHLTSNGEGCL